MSDGPDFPTTDGPLTGENSEALKQALDALEEADENSAEIETLWNVLDNVIEDKKELEKEVAAIRKPTGEEVANANYQMVVDALVRRAQSNDGQSHITVTSEDTSLGARKGIHEVVGDVSKETARKYVHRLADRYDGLSVREGESGGWGGGQKVRLALQMDARTFIETHGDEYGYDLNR